METRVALRGGSRVGDLYYGEAGEGVAILLIHPSGATPRRGVPRSGGSPESDE